MEAGMKKIERKLFAFTLAVVLALTGLPSTCLTSLAADSENAAPVEAVNEPVVTTTVIPQQPEGSTAPDGNDEEGVSQIQDGDAASSEGEGQDNGSDQADESEKSGGKVSLPEENNQAEGGSGQGNGSGQGGDSSGQENGSDQGEDSFGQESGSDQGEDSSGQENGSDQESDSGQQGTVSGNDIPEDDITEPSLDENAEEEEIPEEEGREDALTYTVKILWEDDAQELRPETVKVYLYADESEEKTAELCAQEDWTYTWEDLPAADEEGIRISYHAETESVPEGYELRGTKEAAEEETIKYITFGFIQEADDEAEAEAEELQVPRMLSARRSAVPESWTIRVNWSLWEGLSETEAQEILEKCKPAYVQLQIVDDNNDTLETVQIEGDAQAAEWSAEWLYTGEAVPVSAAVDQHSLYSNETEALVYFPEFSAQVTVNAQSCEIVADCVLKSYTAAAETTSISAQINWGNSYMYLQADDSVVLELYADGQPDETKAQTITAEDGWAYTWENLPVYSDAEKLCPITYTVKQSQLPEHFIESYASTSLVNGVKRYTFYNYYNTRTYGSFSLNLYFRAAEEPDAVPVTLYANGEKYAEYIAAKYSTSLTGSETGSVSLSQRRIANGNYWRWYISSSSMPLYDEYGAPIEWTCEIGDFTGKAGLLEEASCSQGVGYTSYSYYYINELNGAEITIHKSWTDNKNKDLLRPSMVPVRIYADGKLYQTINLSFIIGEETVSGLPYLNSEGEPIVYTIEEGNYSNKESYQTTVSSGGDSLSGRYSFYITSIAIDILPVEMVISLSGNTVNGTKSDVEVELLADGEVYDTLSFTQEKVSEKSEEANGGLTYQFYEENGDWKCKILGLEIRNESGDVIRYEAVHKSPDSWRVSESVSQFYYDSYRRISASISYSSKSSGYDTTIITMAKIWEDEENSQDTRPDSVTFKLYADGRLVDSVQVPTKGDGSLITYDLNNYLAWFPQTFSGTGIPVKKVGRDYCEWTNLPKYNDDGAEICYEVVEEVSSGYQGTIDHVRGMYDYLWFTATNQLADFTVQPSVEIQWNNEPDESVRPETVAVTLTADGKNVGGPVILSAGNNWSYTWAEMEAYSKNGKKIVYDVQQGAVPDAYLVSKSETQNAHFTISNGYQYSNIRVNWINESDYELANYMPASLLLYLYDENGEKVGEEILSGEKSETEWDSVFAYAGQKSAVLAEGLLYSSEADWCGNPAYGIPQYSTQIEVKENGDIEITILLETVSGQFNNSVSITGELAVFTQNESCRAYLYRNGIEVASANVIYMSTYTRQYGTFDFGSWPLMWRNGSRYEEYEYTVVLVKGDGQKIYPYRVSTSQSGNSGEFRKMEFYAENSSDLSVALSWTAFTDLREVEIPITLYYGDEICAQIRAVISDEAEVQITYRNGVTADVEISSWSENWWDYLGNGSCYFHVPFNDLLTQEEGIHLADGEFTFDAELGEFSGKERMSVSTQYYRTNLTLGINEYMKDSLLTEVPLTISKVWTDDSNAPGRRPEEVIYDIYAGNELVESVDLTQEDSITANSNSWSKEMWLPFKNEDGEIISYRIEEHETEGYSISDLRQSLNCESSLSLQGYTYYSRGVFQDVQSVPLTITKYWNNVLGASLPQSITYDIYAGDNLVQSVSLTEADETSATSSKITWSNVISLPYRDEEGEIISYQIEEHESEGYTIYYVSQSLDSGDSYPKEYKYTSYGKKPEEPTEFCKVIIFMPRDSAISYLPQAFAEAGDARQIALLANGEVIRQFTLDGTNETETINGVTYDYECDTTSYTCRIGNLPNLDEEGNQITYSVKYIPPVECDYSEAISCRSDSRTVGGVLSYSFSFLFPLTVTVYGGMEWDDQSNAEGERPETVKLSLYANGERVNTAVLRAVAGDEKWLDWYDRSNGTDVSYIYSLLEIDAYRYSITRCDGPNHCVWNNLPGYDRNGDCITWEVKAESEDGYRQTGIKTEQSNQIYSFTMTNQLIRESVSVSVQKVWKGDDDNEEVRPEEITVQLLNGKYVEDEQVLNEENGWRYTWENIKAIEAGKEINYKVLEVPVEGYVSSQEILEDGTIKITNTYVPDPDDPNDPNDPDNPDDPNDPDNPDDPNEPDDPNDPDDPNVPDEPDDPDEPENSDNPGTPGDPHGPDGADNPNSFGTPENPGAPENVGIAQLPQPEAILPENENGSIPGAKTQTGDETNVGIWLALLAISGAAAAAVLGKRKKKFRRKS